MARLTRLKVSALSSIQPSAVPFPSAARPLEEASSAKIARSAGRRIAPFYSQNLNADARKPVPNERERPRGAFRDVEDPAFDVRPPVGDPHDHGATVREVGDARDGTERQRAMRRHGLVHIEDLAARRPPAVEARAVVARPADDRLDDGIAAGGRHRDDRERRPNRHEKDQAQCRRDQKFLHIPLSQIRRVKSS